MPGREKNMPIDLAVLRRAFDAIFNHLEHDLRIKALKISDEIMFYWNIADGYSYKTGKTAPDFGMGSIQDDYEFVTSMLADMESTKGAPSIMLVHLAPILEFLAKEIGS